MLHGLFLKQISKALPAFCRAGGPENISFVQMWSRSTGVLPATSPSSAAKSWQAGLAPYFWPGPEREAPAASMSFRWGLWMFITNRNQSQGTRQERKGHSKALVTWGYSIQLEHQARKVRGIGTFLWAFWKKQLKQKKCLQDPRQMISLPA